MSPIFRVGRRLRQIASAETFGEWTVVCNTAPVNGSISYECLCVCGTKRAIPGYTLLDGSSRGCGCLRGRKSAATRALKRPKPRPFTLPVYKLWHRVVTQNAFEWDKRWKSCDIFRAEIEALPGAGVLDAKRLQSLRRTTLLSPASKTTLSFDRGWPLFPKRPFPTVQRCRRIVKLLCAGYNPRVVAERLGLKTSEVFELRKALKLKFTKRFKGYLLSQADFNARLKAQSGLCPICKVQLATTKGISRTKAVIDHDHATGQPRAILCCMCNTGLGSFRESPLFMKRAIRYVLNPPIF